MLYGLLGSSEPNISLLKHFIHASWKESMPVDFKERESDIIYKAALNGREQKGFRQLRLIYSGVKQYLLYYFKKRS